MVMKGLKQKMGGKLAVPATNKSFSDKKNFSSYAGTAIKEITALGIMNGYPDGRFGPKDKITFNEMAVMLNTLQGILTP